MMDGFAKGLIGFGAAAVLGMMLFFASCTTVDSGFVGVQKTMGRVNEIPLQPGIHFVKPFLDTVVEMDTRLKSFEITGSAASKDLQVVKTTISVQHSLNGALAPRGLAEIGTLEQFDLTVVSPAVNESFKHVTAQYTAEELITKREAVKSQIEADIQQFIDHTLKAKKIDGALYIANVAVKNFDFSPEFNSSIEAKVRSQQEALKAEIEKRQAITKAEAAAEVMKLDADAKAYEVEKISISRAEAIKREATALHDGQQVLQLRTVEKWDGKLPYMMPGGGTVPFLDLGKMAGKQ